jgi:hypothetical protein
MCEMRVASGRSLSNFPFVFALESFLLSYSEGELADDVCDAKVLVSLITRSSVDVDRKAADSGLRACTGHTNTADFGNNLGVLGELVG